MSEGQHDREVPPAPRAPTIRIWGLGLLAGAALGIALVAWGQRPSEPAPTQVSVPTLGNELPQGVLPTTSEGADVVAPDFEVPTADGGRFRLSDHLATDGRPVLLNLWASWCLPCRKEMPALDAAQKAHPEVHFIGVAVRDRAEDALAFVDEVGATYQIGLDEASAVENAYPPLGMPETYLISSEGSLVRRLFGEMTPDRIERELAAFLRGQSSP